MGNRVQLPKLVRWRYKLESDKVLKVEVSVVGAWAGSKPSTEEWKKRTPNNSIVDVAGATVENS